VLPGGEKGLETAVEGLWSPKDRELEVDIAVFGLDHW